MCLRRFLSAIILITYSSFSYAQILNPYNSTESNSVTGHEYFVGRNLGKHLVTVNLMSGVSAPGIYHIPVDTNLAELFSYAGGSIPSADLEEVILRRKKQDGKVSVEKINFSKLVSRADQLPILQDQDLVHIETSQGLDSSLKWLTIVSLIVTITSAAVVISDKGD